MISVLGSSRSSSSGVKTGYGVHVFKSDVSDPAAIAALYDAVLTQFPALDTLVNNAGITRNLNLRAEGYEQDRSPIHVQSNGQDGKAQKSNPASNQSSLDPIVNRS
jgi:NAD(P)-dependent dehydrogenase (short-subunit alcohol dehydrogenase family)